MLGGGDLGHKLQSRAHLLEVHVQAGNLGILDAPGHALAGSAHVERIAVQ